MPWLPPWPAPPAPSASRFKPGSRLAAYFPDWGGDPGSPDGDIDSLLSQRLSDFLTTGSTNPRPPSSPIPSSSMSRAASSPASPSIFGGTWPGTFASSPSSWSAFDVAAPTFDSIADVLTKALGTFADIRSKSEAEKTNRQVLRSEADIKAQLIKSGVIRDVGSAQLTARDSLSPALAGFGSPSFSLSSIPTAVWVVLALVVGFSVVRKVLR